MHDAIAKSFFAAAVVYGLLGLAPGLDMAMRHDHGHLPTHAHIMVVGWVSFAIFAFFYALKGSAVPRWLALLHALLAQISLPVLVAALWLIYSGYTQFDPLADVSALAYTASFIAFAAAAFTVLRERLA